MRIDATFGSVVALVGALTLGSMNEMLNDEKFARTLSGTSTDTLSGVTETSVIGSETGIAGVSGST